MHYVIKHIFYRHVDKNIDTEVEIKFLHQISQMNNLNFKYITIGDIYSYLKNLNINKSHLV